MGWLGINGLLIVDEWDLVGDGEWMFVFDCLVDDDDEVFIMNMMCNDVKVCCLWK